MKVILNELPKEFTTWTQLYEYALRSMTQKEIFEKGFKYVFNKPIDNKGDWYQILPDYLKEKLLEELTQSLTTNRIVGYHFDSMDEKFANVLYCVNGNYHSSSVGLYLMTDDEQKRFLSLCGKRMTYNEIGEFLNNQIDKK